MKRLGDLLFFSLLILTPTLIATVFAYWMSSRRSLEIDTVNLGKIVNAQQVIAGRVAGKDVSAAPWMATIHSASQQLRETIREVAGANAIVVVSPAVIQGAHDITSEVMRRLGLPTNLPDIRVPRGELFLEHKKAAPAPEVSYLRP